ncbi:MAG TPA: 2-dehydropantoate 2-reductase [Burkholderiales bacterium]
MRILVFGAGGVGGYFGARLAASGVDVTFVARGEHLRAMRSQGLRVESGLGNLVLQPVQATDTVAGTGAFDYVLIGVKLWDTETAAQAVAPAVGLDTAVISFQNGVDAVDLLTRRYGRERVMGGIAHIAAYIEAPGVIRHNGTLQRLTFGELDGSRSARGERLYEACRRAGIETVLSDKIEHVIWEKFVFIVGLSAMTALTRLPIGPIREEPLTRQLLADIMREADAVARARGVDLGADSVERQLGFMDTLPAGMIASMLGDLRRGNRLELPWLSGAVVRLGDSLGVATPANRFVCAALALHANGRHPAAAD